MNRSYSFMAILSSLCDQFEADEKAMLMKMAECSHDANDDEDSSDLLTIHGDISVVSIAGKLTNVNSWINRYFGFVSYDEIRKAVIEGSENSKAMLLHISSGGGRVAGMADVAELISSLSIPTVTYSDETMASAALFLGIQSDHVLAGGFAEVGSVGVIMSTVDQSEAMKKMGVTPIRFRSGDLKQSGHPYFKMSDKEKKYMQEQVDIYAEKFFGIVSEARGIPRPMLDKLDITSGRTFIGEQALACGLVDGICTFDQAVVKTMTLAQKNIDKNKQSAVTYGQY